MTNKLWAYYYTLIGAIGGLIGWIAATFLMDVMNGQNASLMARTLIKGLVVGAGIGAAICGRERLVTTDWKRGLQDAMIGGIAGAAAGAASSILGFYLFNRFGQNLAGRIFGYISFGAIIGMGEGLKWIRSGVRRLVRGALGGALGGIIAALTYDVLASQVNATLGDAIATMMFGLLMGLFVASAYLLGNMAVLRVIAAPKDKMVDQFLPLGTVGKKDILGSNPNNSIPMITDDTLAPEHAIIYLNGREFSIEPLEDPITRQGIVIVDGERLKPQTRTPLVDGMVIQAGASIFEFHLLKGAKVVSNRDGALNPETDADKKQALYRG